MREFAQAALAEFERIQAARRQHADEMELSQRELARDAWMDGAAP